MPRKQNRKVPYRLRLTVAEVGDEPLSMLSLSTFLYDLLVLHDRIMLLSSRYDYAYNPTRWFYGRQARRKMEKPDRLQVKLITRESPLVLEVILAAAAIIGGTWAFVQIVEKLRDWPDDRAIKKATRENLELDVAEKRRLLQMERRQLGDEFALLPAKPPAEEEPIEDTIVKDARRLATNKQLQVVDTEILEYVEEDGEDY